MFCIGIYVTDNSYNQEIDKMKLADTLLVYLLQSNPSMLNSNDDAPEAFAGSAEFPPMSGLEVPAFNNRLWHIAAEPLADDWLEIAAPTED